MWIMSGADRELAECTKFISNMESEKLLQIRTWNLIGSGTVRAGKLFFILFFNSNLSSGVRARETVGFLPQPIKLSKKAKTLTRNHLKVQGQAFQIPCIPSSMCKCTTIL